MVSEGPTLGLASWAPAVKLYSLAEHPDVEMCGRGGCLCHGGGKQEARQGWKAGYHLPRHSPSDWTTSSQVPPTNF